MYIFIHIFINIYIRTYIYEEISSNIFLEYMFIFYSSIKY